MREFRKKQKKLFTILKTLVIFSAVFIFIFIGAKPYIENASELAASVCSYVCDILAIAVIVTLFLYSSKYGKSDSFLKSVENELSDTGYYLTSRVEKDLKNYVDAIFNDLKSCGYAMNSNIEINEFDFDFKANKSKEFFYCTSIESVDRNDILAYIDAVVFDITVKSLKRKADAVICFVTDKADDDAIALSKMITRLGKKEKINIALAICELSSRRVYFLGNEKTKCQQLIANYVMNCDLPIKEQYIGKERLPFQNELEEKMKSFNIKDFKNGNFTAH
ncbi:MAG: hypothetical protein K2H13_01335 [Eubacterium sp.]|nr:hypothetical protein [Eubacterium sp.]